MKICRCLLILAILTSASATFAQSTNASLTGTVEDPSKAVIGGVSITAINTLTGVKVSTSSSKNGQYILPGLEPGSYRVEVEKQGFKGIIEAGLVLHVQDIVQMNFHMAVGSASETVSVDGSGLQLNTTDASVSTVVDQKFVENMPLNGRSFQDLIDMTPGVVTQSPQVNNASPGYQGDFSVNGQRTESNYYTVDGLSASGGGAAGGNPQPGNSGAVAATTALGTTQSILSVDALQEFRVSSSTYSAQAGRSPGGQFSFSTRAGTNHVHGTLYDYFRNDILDANDWFNDNYGLKKTALRQNDFGGTIGGPIWIPYLYKGTDKSFFFLSYEGLRLVQPQAATTQYVPSLAVRASAPPPMQGVLNAFPIPTGPEIATAAGLSGLSPFVLGYSLPASINSTSLRLDQILSKRWSAFLRAAYTPSSSQTRNLSSLETSSIGTTTFAFGLTGQFSSRVTNDFRMGYSHSRSALDMSLDSFGGAVPTNLRTDLGITGNYAPSAAEPYIVVSGIGTTYIFAYDAVTKFQQWNINDTVTLSLNRHYVTAGIDERHIESPILPPALVVLPEWFSRSSLLTNSADVLDIQKNAGKVPVTNQLSAFIQDEWKLMPTLTLSAGARWELDPAPKEANGNDAYTIDGNINQPSTITLAPRGTPLWDTYWYNIAPRLGVAWVFHGKSGYQTVIRAGGGTYFDTANQIASDGFGGIGFYAFTTATAAPIPVTTAQTSFTTAATAPYTSTGIYAFPHHLQLPYALERSTAVEQELGKDQSLTITYVGSSGRRQLQLQRHSINSINPEFGSVYYVANGIVSNYNALQMKFQRTIASGLQALVSYTWSHSLDFGSNNASLPLTYGNSDFDVRNNLQLGMSWNLPRYHGARAIEALANDWAIDERVMARTAFPITLEGQQYTDPTTGDRYYGNLNLVPNQPTYLHGSQYPGGKAINSAAFAYPATASAAGTASRNFVRGFGESQWNSSIRRSFHLYDPFNLVFKAEAFNILNHPNFGYVDPTLTDAQFGRATSMLNQSLGETNQLYQQGGPRSFQFALKLTF